MRTSKGVREHDFGAEGLQYPPGNLEQLNVEDIGRSWAGASPTVGGQPCAQKAYTPSALETQWSQNVLAWTADPCKHISHVDALKWVGENEKGNLDPKIFSTICLASKEPQYIEPLAGLLRDPRALCPEWKQSFVMSVDWLVFADSKILNSGITSRFYDAGGTKFKDALDFFLGTYKKKGITFDEVYVWEINKQGVESYWQGVDPATRAFWAPRLTFYDGVGVTAEIGSNNNPVSLIYKNCAPNDFCAFKLDIDTPSVEFALVQQLLNTPNETTAKLDEMFFEHHVHGLMQANGWGNGVQGTYQDSYNIFSRLRHLGVRAHSWV